VTEPNVLRSGHEAHLDLKLPKGIRNGIAVVTLENPLANVTLESLDGPLSPVERVRRLKDHWRRYNDRVLATMRVEIKDGKPVGPVQLPRGISPGRYLLRVAVLGENGAATGIAEDCPVESEQPEPWFGGI
jgi:hypothetical protein